MSAYVRLSDATLDRLPIYLRAVSRHLVQSDATVSSVQLAAATGFSSDTVRRDLWLLKVAGVPGVGYRASDLHSRLTEVLGAQGVSRVGIAGAGNIGSALAHYLSRPTSGFLVVALFDSAPEVLGSSVAEVPIFAASDLTSVASEHRVEIGVITTPETAAQQVADQFMQAGVTALLNFAPTRLDVPQSVHVRHVDVLGDLLVLQHLLSSEPAARSPMD